MAQRDEVYKRFGPLQIEALLDELLDNINENRIALGKPAVTKNAFLGKAHNNLAHLEPYNWMNESEV